ncbi:DUF4124 domain-containing protein [Undibacterium sp. FT79W]|uniref:DUF4124 domain-containing protein n=1 Tax=Undibacterium sp. FT79W TaxID=2762296 RepID=UPI00164AC606|nr:DUF4124 domain-containing protein [Undibacterium sp. FT79W]MBC3877526.1 DUF4124 domain-containing protein [Undibacterium sp. FT79W]
MANRKGDAIFLGRGSPFLSSDLFSGDAVNYCRSIAILLASASLWALASDAASINMNRCKLSDGRIEFTDQPCPSDASSASIESNASPHPTQQKHLKAKNRIALSGLPPEDRMTSCEPSIAIAAAEEIVSNPSNLKEPLQLFPPAFAFFQNGKKDDGVFWFYAAQLRVRQQMILENGDRGQLLAITQMTMGGPINNYAFQNTSNLNQILDRVLKWDKDTPNPFREKARTQKLDKQMDQVYAGLDELKSKLINEKNSLEAAARQAASGVEQMNAQMISQRCRKGQPDPAYDNQTKKTEEQLALDYITHNEQVIKLAGGAVKTYPAASTTYSNDRNKGRYDFSISGSKSFYAIVDVNRSSGKPEFRLACVTTLSMGYREAGKDACSQSTIALPK